MSTDIQAAKKAYQKRRQRQFEQREVARENALKQTKEAVPDIAAKFEAIRAIFLFGSILRPGAFHPESDIDIAVEAIGAEDYFRFWQALEEALPDWTIDLRDLSPGTAFAQQVYRTGEKIYD